MAKNKIIAIVVGSLSFLAGAHYGLFNVDVIKDPMKTLFSFILVAVGTVYALYVGNNEESAPNNHH